MRQWAGKPNLGSRSRIWCCLEAMVKQDSVVILNGDVGTTIFEL